MKRGHSSTEQRRQGGAEKWKDLCSTVLPGHFRDWGERGLSACLQPTSRFLWAVLGALLLRKGVVLWLEVW